MIESISITNVATFRSPPQELNGLSNLNFIFGSNGSGKTTISRLIADEIAFPSCAVRWKAGTKLQPLVYNYDFVERNFNQSPELKGVFTLGEKQLDTLSKIASTKLEIDALTEKVENLTHTLQGIDGNGGKKGELAALESGFKDKCWAQKQKHDPKLQGGFKGYRNKAEEFKTKILQEESSNIAILLSLIDLEKKAESVFGSTPTNEVPIAALDTAELVAHETNLILRKRVIGKADVDIAAMITKLGNSDWVRTGQVFYEANERYCPFCQQVTTDSFAKSLNEYFDEAFAIDSKAIEDLTADYAADSARVQRQAESIIASPSKFLDLNRLKMEYEVLIAKIELNIRHIARKKGEPSQTVELDSLVNVIAAMKTIIENANIQIAAHNSMVANLASEQATLTSQIWKYVLEELKTELSSHKAAKADLNKAITALSDQVLKATEGKTKKTFELRELEKQTTSVQPTIDNINALLTSFGFQGFKLAKAASGTSYKLVRPDGTDAKATLSEGEKTFITFLYFYHLLKGSDSESGMTADRIVVFDDPVSSLDSDILFIVGSLIKGLFDEVLADSGNIKQIFVLTHNVYFHKEVTYNSRRRDVAMNEETFWIVRKVGLTTSLEKHTTNPIKTSYELLWAEVRRPDRSNLAIQNTLRRILENYFKILGNIDFDKLCGLFEGKEKLICKSLFSWVHDGSHYAHDDLFISIEDTMVETYLNVFRLIFEKSEHGPHYKMMMGDAYVESPASATATVPTVTEAVGIAT